MFLDKRTDVQAAAGLVQEFGAAFDDHPIAAHLTVLLRCPSRQLAGAAAEALGALPGVAGRKLVLGQLAELAAQGQAEAALAIARLSPVIATRSGASPFVVNFLIASGKVFRSGLLSQVVSDLKWKSDRCRILTPTDCLKSSGLWRSYDSQDVQRGQHGRPTRGGTEDVEGCRMIPATILRPKHRKPHWHIGNADNKNPQSICWTFADDSCSTTSAA